MTNETQTFHLKLAENFLRTSTHLRPLPEISRHLNLDSTCSFIITNSGHHTNHFIAPSTVHLTISSSSTVWQLSCLCSQGRSRSCHVYSRYLRLMVTVWAHCSTDSRGPYGPVKEKSPSHTLFTVILWCVYFVYRRIHIRLNLILSCWILCWIFHVAQPPVSCCLMPLLLCHCVLCSVLNITKPVENIYRSYFNLKYEEKKQEMIFCLLNIKHILYFTMWDNFCYSWRSTCRLDTPIYHSVCWW